MTGPEAIENGGKGNATGKVYAEDRRPKPLFRPPDRIVPSSQRIYEVCSPLVQVGAQISIDVVDCDDMPNLALPNETIPLQANRARQQAIGPSQIRRELRNSVCDMASNQPIWHMAGHDRRDRILPMGRGDARAGTGD
jgi:hypothetical protein